MLFSYSWNANAWYFWGWWPLFGPCVDDVPSPVNVQQPQAFGGRGRGRVAAPGGFGEDEAIAGAPVGDFAGGIQSRLGARSRWGTAVEGEEYSGGPSKRGRYWIVFNPLPPEFFFLLFFGT